MTKQEIAASIRARFGQDRGVINLTDAAGGKREFVGDA